MVRHRCLSISFATLIITSFGLAQEIRIPVPIRSYIDSTYPGWRFSTISEEMTNAFFRPPRWNPNFIRGDFDGNGRWDYAIQITYPDSNRQFRAVIAFLAIATGFKPFVLQRVSDDPDYYLVLTTKGAERFDFEEEEPFRCPSDGVDIAHAGNSGRTYFFKNGKFTSKLTAD